jgi:competence protein ComEA
MNPARTWLLAAAAAVLVVLAFRSLSGGHADATPPVAVQPSGLGRGARLWVHVDGSVRRPGLYRLRPGARVGDAVARAGGPRRRAELGGVNLAAKVQDGQQVVVPRRGEGGVAGGAPAPGSASTAAAPGSSGPSGPPIRLATATIEQLDTLDGIGPTLAQRIVEYRQAQGGFGSLEELREVEGIGEKRFESLSAGLAP